MSQSAIINVMRAAVEKAGRALRRDFGEIEHLQVSKKGQGDVVALGNLRKRISLFDRVIARARAGHRARRNGCRSGGCGNNRTVTVDPGASGAGIDAGTPDRFVVFVDLGQKPLPLGPGMSVIQ